MEMGPLREGAREAYPTHFASKWLKSSSTSFGESPGVRCVHGAELAMLLGGSVWGGATSVTNNIRIEPL
jgi:hypothetical protein